MSDDVRSRVKRWYATGAQAVGGGLGRVGLLPDRPPERTHRARHWAYSLTRVRDPFALIELDTPWWTYAATAAVERWIADRPAPPRVLEWGAGASTVWLARRAASVLSVEHDADFAAALSGRLHGFDAVRLEVVAPTRRDDPAVPSAKEGFDGVDFADYVHAADGDGPFDLVVVDGRARAACLEATVPLLGEDPLIVFDNSRRRRYRAAIDGLVSDGFTEQALRGLTPTLPYPEQTSLLRRRAAGRPRAW